MDEGAAGCPRKVSDRVDTPEIKRKEECDAAIWVKEELENLLKPGAPMVITSMAYDRTGQVRAEL